MPSSVPAGNCICNWIILIFWGRHHFLRSSSFFEVDMIFMRFSYVFLKSSSFFESIFILWDILPFCEGVFIFEIFFIVSCYLISSWHGFSHIRVKLAKICQNLPKIRPLCEGWHWFLKKIGNRHPGVRIHVIPSLQNHGTNGTIVSMQNQSD